MCEVGLSSVIVTKGISGVSLDGLIARRYEIILRQNFLNLPRYQFSLLIVKRKNPLFYNCCNYLFKAVKAKNNRSQ